MLTIDYRFWSKGQAQATLKARQEVDLEHRVVYGTRFIFVLSFTNL